MGVVAAGAKIVGPLARTCKGSRPFSMDAGLPVLVDIAMTFAAEPIAFGKVDQLPIIKSQLISILCIMTIEAPPHCLRMVEFDLGMFFL